MVREGEKEISGLFPCFLGGHIVYTCNFTYSSASQQRSTFDMVQVTLPLLAVCCLYMYNVLQSLPNGILDPLL